MGAERRAPSNIDNALNMEHGAQGKARGVLDGLKGSPSTKQGEDFGAALESSFGECSIRLSWFTRLGVEHDRELDNKSLCARLRSYIAELDMMPLPAPSRHGPDGGLSSDMRALARRHPPRGFAHPEDSFLPRDKTLWGEGSHCVRNVVFAKPCLAL